MLSISVYLFWINSGVNRLAIFFGFCINACIIWILKIVFYLIMRSSILPNDFKCLIMIIIGSINQICIYLKPFCYNFASVPC